MNRPLTTSRPAPASAATGRLNPRDNFYRCAVAMLRYRAEPRTSAEQHLTRMFPNDTVSPVLLRAATSPATISTSAWAGSLALGAVADVVTNLGPVSAASQLFRAGLQVRFEG